MNQEEKALLANISTILVKDIGIDKKNNFKKPLSIQDYFLFDDDPDDGLDLFIYEIQNKKQKLMLKVEKNKTEQENGELKTSSIDEGISTKVIAEETVAPKHTEDAPKDDGIFTLDFKNISSGLFQDNLHITENTYDNLLEAISFLFRKKAINLNESTKKSIVSLGLWKLTTDEHIEEIIRRFSNANLNLTRDTCLSSIKEFYNLLSSNFNVYVKWPTTKDSQQTTFENFQQLKQFEKFPECFGILITKQINVFLESKNEEIPLIFQLACKSDGTITFCQVNSVDLYVFNETPLGKLIRNENYLPSGNYYFLADTGYPLQKTIIKEFPKTFNQKEKEFNKLHNAAIQIGRNVFRKLLQRFHILLGLEACDIQVVQKIFKTICILHNLCEKFSDTYDLNAKSSIKNDFDEIKFEIKNDSDEDGIGKRLELMSKIL